MINYRIVANDGRYRIQYRFAFLFWIFYKLRTEEDWRIAPNEYYYKIYETTSIDEANQMISTLRNKEKWQVVVESKADYIIGL